jgi:hypothetical protein
MHPFLRAAQSKIASKNGFQNKPSLEMHFRGSWYFQPSLKMSADP